MNEFSRVVQIRWSDLDPNLHIRHSVYYDWGAFCRIEVLNEFDITAGVLMDLQVGIVLLREECIFRREIKSGDKVSIDLKMTRAKMNYSRFGVQHNITKNNNMLSAIINVELAWIDARQRKLISPPDQILKALEQMPKADSFEWTDKQKP